jgi:large subunit ribosomal protein L18
VSRLTHKSHNARLRKNRVRATIVGTPERPRLRVHISNRHISAQVIDDSKHSTVAAITTVGQKAVSGSMVERAAWAGSEIAKKAKAAKVKQVVFDRGGRLYHGRIKALADAARAEGLEF